MFETLVQVQMTLKYLGHWHIGCVAARCSFKTWVIAMEELKRLVNAPNLKSRDQENIPSKLSKTHGN